MQIALLIKETYTKGREWKGSDSYGWISEEAHSDRVSKFKPFKNWLEKWEQLLQRRGGRAGGRGELQLTVNQATE